MSLSLKYLAPLNLVILLVWGLHFLGSRASLEEAMLATERDAMEQLAVALGLHLERALADGDGVESVARGLETLASRWPELDLMVVDDTFTVLLASEPDRVGGRWYEASIEAVLLGASSVWNLEGHLHDGRRAVDVSVGVASPDGQVRHVVHIGKWLDRLLTALHAQRRQDLGLAVLELLAVALAVNLLTFWLVLRPLVRIRRRITSSGWSAEHSQVHQRDEIRHLEAVVTTMLQQVQARHERLRSTLGEHESALKELSAHRDHLAHRVERVSGELAATEARLVRAERIAAVAQLSGALAHELRNPLHIIRATAETVASRYSEAAELASDIMDEVDRVNRLIAELLAYSRPSDLSWQAVDLRALLEGVRERMCRGLCDRDPASCALCTVEVGPGAATLVGDPVLLEQAVMNLYANAHEMSPEGMPVEVRADRDDSGRVVVTVADRGPGIADEDLDRVFEPFFTRKSYGTGLGLPVVQKIADLHEGAVELSRRPGGGTVARLWLPASPTGGQR